MNHSESKNKNFEEEIRNSVTQFGQAFLEADVETLESLLTENYIHVNGGSGSVLNRTEWLDWVRSRRTELENDQLHINEYRVEDIIVKTHQNVAVVTGVVYSSGTHKNEAFSSQVRFSNTWIFSDNTWKRVSFHDSPLPNPEN